MCETPSPIKNSDLTIVASLKDSRIRVLFKGEAIASFAPETPYDDVINWIRTNGYLAEFMRLRHIAAVTTKEDVSWNELMRVSL